MRFDCGRQAWHDAFMADIKATDIEEVLTGFGVQFTAKGADNKIMDQCEKGIVQNAIAKLKERDPLAHAWGMFAYTPDGWPAAAERGRLLGYLLAEYNQWTGFEHRDNKVHQDKVRFLARLAMHETARRDRGCAAPYSMDTARQAVGCFDDFKRWDKEWKPVWRKLRRWLEPFPGRSLSSVSAVVMEYRERQYPPDKIVCA